MDDALRAGRRSSGHSEWAGGLQFIDVAYRKPLAAGGGLSETVLRNDAGQVTTYRHRIEGNDILGVEALGAGCERCSRVNHRYEAHGAAHADTALKRSAMLRVC